MELINSYLLSQLGDETDPETLTDFEKLDRGLKPIPKKSLVSSLAGIFNTDEASGPNIKVFHVDPHERGRSVPRRSESFKVWQ